MSEEQVIIDDFNQITRGHWTTNEHYDSVNALLLYWTEDDLNVTPEVLKFKQLLEGDFNFKARVYNIPSENSAAQLSFELACFVRQHSLKTRSLSIIYYAGHADNLDEESTPGYSEWRAKKDGGPTLNWFLLQQSLCNASGDVLVILDCCHAALKTRGEKEGKMEVLAACGSGSRVPGPGRLSFTSVLIRQIRKRLNSGNDMNVKWLHNHLWADKTEPGLTVNPVYFDLSKHDQRSIILKPLELSPPEGFARKSKPASSFMFLKVTLEDDPTGLQIANWLKSFPPKVIKDVDIEGLVLKARRLEDLTNRAELFPGSVLGKLSQPAQTEILQRLWGLSHIVSSTTAFANEIGASANPTEEASNQSLAEGVVNDIQNKVADVCESIEGGILLDSGIDLNEAAEDEIIKVAGAEDAISLRQQLLNNAHISNTPQLERGTVKLMPNKQVGSRQRFRYGTIAGKPILVESFRYTTIEAESSEAPPNTISQIKRMVTQLSHPKRTSFHILPCIGYLQEPHAKRFSVVFELEQNHDIEEPPAALCDFYTSRRRVPLGLRIQLARTLAAALENFHRVGWVHKELNSENIRFLRKESELVKGNMEKGMMKSADVELTQPWLFGFECSRPEDAESDLNPDFAPKTIVYRHPERWGKPTIKYEKYHDVYALGMVFLEIAFWKLAAQFEEMRERKLDPWKIRQQLLIRASNDLPHRVGQNFANAIDACLRFKELSEGLDDFHRHQEYKVRILDTLESTAKSV